MSQQYVIIPDPPASAITGELSVLRKQTRMYIQANPIHLVLVRQVKTPDGAGGHKDSPLPLAPQTMRLIQQDRVQTVERRNRDGVVVRPIMTLQAEWTADVEEGDEFVWDDKRFEVVYITEMSSAGGVYERMCEVATR